MSFDDDFDEQHDKPPVTIRDGAPLRVRRSYTMSEAALEQRRSAQATRTPESFEKSKKNSWKHGRYAASRLLGVGKPCKSSCPDYPCSLVEEGKCRPGAACMDKEHLYESCMAIEKALLTQDFVDFNQLMVLELAESLSVVRELRASVLEHGAVVECAKVDKEGKIIAYELKPHPSLLALPNLMKNLGISFNDFMMTPAAIERKKTEDKAVETLADLFASAGSALAQAKKKKEGV